MENQDQLLKSFNWTFKARKATLNVNNEFDVTLRSISKNHALFKLHSNKIEVKNKGFWKPLTVVGIKDIIYILMEKYRKKDNYIISTNSGNKYTLSLKGKKLIKTEIRSAANHILCYYKLVSKNKAVFFTDRNLSDVLFDEYLQVLILGCFVFRSIIKEKKLAKLKSLSISNPT